MEARHLRYAQALAEHRHFGRAAASLGIAQPPLSSQIAALEREVGERLFDRTPKGVFPTAAGTAFLARARSALDEMGGAVVDAGRAARGETGRLRLGFIGSALLAPLPGVLGRFQRARPDFRLEALETGTPAGVAGLLAGELDVAVGRGAPRGPGAEELVTVPIGTDDLVAAVAVTHPFAGTRSVTIEQLAGERLVVSGRADEPGVGAWLQTVFADAPKTVFADAPTALDGAATARDIHTIVGLAACGVGVGLGPSRMRLLARDDVRFCDVTPAVRLPDLQLSFRASDDSPVLAAFLDVVRLNCDEVGSRLDRILSHHPGVGAL
ncbi:LysR family transcriptional regulator [Pseudonocardia sp. Ae406_Ps2]|uniref:LysR family transcriptional regulator n=1 Tax=unclassified Pseudonocardia TaxID=2619320 RepID=UPI00094AF2F6|nr:MULTISPECIES: LysR family transcriptional regulator [unclassified Pseudonocardia]OLM01585.1 LysR family transcriptional regulator [Pseudonocardia sp. Ae406_Ps2]OLM06612.1 LysR family transcriptional regulator [Pseudonocardia sp. Ae331_Ps2]OLM13366.1 LysR family transcriptional regulator [Pseudonocardia sp. Ae505_Ps2]OLM23157.1 LysR family transcriptional regulator [Pseudonocardia sp. Ae706_Ps2]